MERDILNQLNSFKDKHILVIGDFILDIYMDTQCDRLTPEASVPVLDVQHTKHALGGAANVAFNIEQLGAKVSLLTILGQDENSKKAIQLFKDNQQKSLFIHFSTQSQTLCKTRILKNGHLLYRLDEGKHIALEADQMDLFLNDMIELYDKCDAVYIADYNKGCMHYRVIDLLEELQNKQPKPIVIDSKNYLQYRNVHPSIIKPNYSEAINITNQQVQEDRIKQAPHLINKLLEISNAKKIALTLDCEGVYVANSNGPHVYVEGCQTQVSNTSGAGDIFLSTLLLGQLVGMDDATAAKTACRAAAIGISKKSTAHCTIEQLKLHLLKECGKIVPTIDLMEHLSSILSKHSKIVLTTGCFDIFHSGHANLFRQAKQKGDILVVGINTDESIARLKDPLRPVNALEDRIEVLKALEYVDFVVPFGDLQDDTPATLIQKIKPQVFVKGEDYQDKNTAEKKILLSLGIQQVFIPLVPHQYTTKIINRVQVQDINLKKIG